MTDIRKRQGKNGTSYQVRYANPALKAGYGYKTFNTLKEARAFREDARLREQTIQRQSVSIEEGLQLWLDVCEKEGRGGRNPVTPYTLKTYYHKADVILAYDWPKPLDQLKAPDVVEFRSWLLQYHSRDQAKKVLSHFHSMVLELVHRGKLDHDFVAGIGVSSISRYDKPKVIPSEKDIQSLLAAADRLANSRNAQIARTWARYRPMLYLAIDSGMRPQEYVVAERSNLTERGIQVDRALEAGHKKLSVPKSAAGRRFIDLSPQTVSMVRHYADKIALSNHYDLIFPAEGGRWQSPNNWRRRGFSRACTEAGLIKEEKANGKVAEKPKYKLYDLRHFYASMLIEKRVSLKRIQQLMGHADIQTTLNVYGHVIERVELEQSDRTQLISSLT